MRFFIAYRDNGLYRRYMPELVKGLDIVDTFTIPQGTEFADMQEAAIRAADRAVSNGATCILSDWTCYRLTYAAKWDEPRFENKASLSSLFYEQIEKWYPDNTVADNFLWFGKQLIGQRTVKRFVVVWDHLRDHIFAGNDRQEMYAPERGDWLAGLLKEAFPEASVLVVRYLDDAYEFFQDPEALIVADRHCTKFDMPDLASDLGVWPHAAMIYLLPFETTNSLLVNAGLCDRDFDIPAMQAKLLKG